MKASTDWRAVTCSDALTIKPATRLGMMIYVAYLALCLPFICWGRIADPHHSHLAPHLVFAEFEHELPIIRHANHDQRLLEALAFFLFDDPTLLSQIGKDAHDVFPLDDSTGAATPSLLVLALLNVLLLLTVAFRLHLQRSTRWHYTQLSFAEYTTTAPTPPPRRLPCVYA